MEHQGDQDNATSDGGKSLNVADLENEHEENEEKGEDNTNKKEIEGELKSHERVCPLCNKKFSSGKAFGGHMSSKHVQQAKGQNNKSSSKKLTKRKHNYKYHANSSVGHDGFIDEFDEDGDSYSGSLVGKMGFKNKSLGYTCDYCDKDFPSKKSLFGHMRCHPDRPYRGMDPPNCNNINNGAIKNSSVFTSHVTSQSGELEEEGRNQENWNFGNCMMEEGVSSEAFGHVDGMMEAGESVSPAATVVDLAQDLVGRGWYIKGRRGEKSIANNETHEDEEEDSFEEHCMASHLLMHFHNSGGSKSNLDDGKDKGRIAEKHENSSSGEDEVEAVGVIDQLKKNKEKSKAILENVNMDDDDNPSGDTESDDEVVRKLHYARKGKGKVVEKTEKKRMYINVENIIIKKVKISPSSLVLSDHRVTSPSSVAPPPPPPRAMVENGKVFTCPSCGKVFQTHQALGGHKSSHNKFKVEIYNAIPDEVTPCDKGRIICKKMKKKAMEATKVRRGLNFDLNQLANGES